LFRLDVLFDVVIFQGPGHGENSLLSVDWFETAWRPLRFAGLGPAAGGGMGKLDTVPSSAFPPYESALRPVKFLEIFAQGLKHDLLDTAMCQAETVEGGASGTSEDGMTFGRQGGLLF